MNEQAIERDGSPPAQPIFVVSSFRTCSTWLWARLRAAATTMAYYEIFHPGLAMLKPQILHQSGPSAWASGHPDSAGYFLEYLPLFRDAGGLPGHDPSMAMDSFLPAGGFGGDLTPNERDYVASLIAHAEARRMVPVLTCTRILGRAHALRKAFPSRVVLVHRNIFHQWASCSAQAAGGNMFFIEACERMLAATKRDPFVASLDHWFKDRTPSPYDEKCLAAFCVLHLYLYAKAFDAVDLFVDATAVASDRDLCDATARRLSDMVGAPVDLSDAKANIEGSLVEVRSPTAFADSIEQFAKQIVGLCSSAGAAAFVLRLKDEFLAEWSRYEFYAGGVRAIVSRQRNDLVGQLNEARTQMAVLTQHRDALAAQLDAANKTPATASPTAHVAPAEGKPPIDGA